MNTRILAVGGVALAVIAVLFVLTLRPSARTRPSLPPMTGSCATGLGTQSLCAEWSGDGAAGKRSCSTLGGTWNETPCAAAVSSAGGTCVVTSAGSTGLLHYGSGWIASSPRAQQHCAAQKGAYYPN